MNIIAEILAVCVISSALSVTYHTEISKVIDRVTQTTAVVFDDNIVVDMMLPRGFTVLKTDDKSKIYSTFDLNRLHDTERFNIADEDGDIVVAVSLTAMESEEDAVNSGFNPNALYRVFNFSPEKYNWNNGYTPVTPHGREGAGTTEVYYRSDIGESILVANKAGAAHFKIEEAYDSDGHARLNLYNKGVLAYNLDLMKYAAVELNYDCVTDEQLKDTAKTIRIRQTAPVPPRPKTEVNFSDTTVFVTLPKGYTVLDTYDAKRKFAAFLSEVSGKAEQFNIANADGVIVGAISVANLSSTVSSDPKLMYSEIMNGDPGDWGETKESSVRGSPYTWEDESSLFYEGGKITDINKPRAVPAAEGVMTTSVSYRYNNPFLNAEDKERMLGCVIPINGRDDCLYYFETGILAYNLVQGKYAAVEFDLDAITYDKKIELIKSIKLKPVRP